MKHLDVLYFFIAFSIGMASLAIAIVSYMKTHVRFMRDYVCFYLAFTLLVTTSAVYSYFEANLPDLAPAVFLALDYLDVLAVHLLIFVFPAFAHGFLGVSHRKLRNIIFGIIAIVVYVMLHFFGLLTYYVQASRAFEHAVEFPDIVLVGVVAYAFGISWHAFRTSAPSPEKNFARTFWMLCGMALVVVVCDIVLYVESVTLFPILYGSFGLVFARHFIVHNLRPPYIPSDDMAKESFAVSESILEPFHFSPREKDVLPLLLQGYTNSQIAEELYISLNTVKTHIRNIYQKVGVKRRYELLARFKDLRLSSDPHNS